MKKRFHRPADLQDALTLLADLGESAAPIAGGTDLTLQIRMGRRPNTHLVGLGDVDLTAIALVDDRLEIGATAPLTAIADHADVQRVLPTLAEACRQIGGRQVQSVATLGGNLNNASPAADSAPPLLVADASVRLASVAGTREVPLAEFFQGPGRTARRADELLTAVLVPVPQKDSVFHCFRKYGPRRSNIISAVTFAARLELDGGTLTDVRLAVGSVAPTPIRVPSAEAWLTGRTLDETLLSDPELAAAVTADVAPIDDVRGSARYKTKLAVNSVRFALSTALRGGGEE